MPDLLGQTWMVQGPQTAPTQGDHVCLVPAGEEGTDTVLSPTGVRLGGMPHTHTHTHTHTATHTQSHTHTHTATHTQAHTHTHTALGAHTITAALRSDDYALTPAVGRNPREQRPRP